MTYTKSEIQLIVNAVSFFKENNKTVKPHLIAFVDNDLDFIEKFNNKVLKHNARAEIECWPLAADFDEQIQWDIDAFRNIKEIRELAT